MTIKYDIVRFDSVNDLAEHVETLETDDTRPANRGRDSGYTSDMEFYGNWTIEDAIKTGREGGKWQEGADKMPRLHVPHETLSGAALPAPYLNNDIQGFAPNVPAYLSGTPDSMFDMIEQPAGDKLLRVAVHVGRYFKCSQNNILNRGSAIMAVLDQLSLEGYSIELHAVWRNSNSGVGVSVETCIKSGVDHWSPASVAFALCHASFQRRLCWRTAEGMTEQGGSITADGYGSGFAAEFEDFDLSFGYVGKDTNDNFNTIGKAADYIKEITICQLNSRK